MYLLDLLVDNDAYSMLRDVINASRFAVVALMRHAFLNGSCALSTNILLAFEQSVKLCIFNVDHSPSLSTINNPFFGALWKRRVF